MVAVAAVVVGIVAAVVVGIVAAVVVAIAAVLVGIVATVVVGIVAIVVVGIVATVHAITVVVTVTIAVIDIVVAGLVTAVVVTVFAVFVIVFAVPLVIVAAAVVAIVVVGLVQSRFLKGRYSNFGLTHVARTLFGSSLDRRFLGLGSCTGTRYWIGRGFGNVAFSLIFDLNCRLRVDRRMGYFVLNHSVHHICLRPLFFAIHCGNLLFGLCSSFRLTF